MMLLLIAGKGGDYCDTEVFRAECSDGQVVMTERARYGRMQLGRCVEIDLGYIGCQRDVLDVVDRRCSGLRVCEMRIPDAELESTRACLKELKTYLQVSYRCVTRKSIPHVSASDRTARSLVNMAPVKWSVTSSIR